MLKITGELRKASPDMRLTASSIPESEAGANPNGICDTVTAKYHETANVNGAQLIFSDLSIPKDKQGNVDDESETDENFSTEDVYVYERIKHELIKRGIPANQIAFVHDAKASK